MSRLVSVIVPVYNTAPYLDRCIKSILNQTYQQFELLLIDDGSTDSSGEICDRYAGEDSRIRVFHKANGGVSSARNMGMTEMRGEAFLFLDSDDALEKETLQTCIDAMIGEAADVVVFGWQELMDGKTVNAGRYDAFGSADVKQMVCDILKDRHIYGGGYPNKLWRTEAFLKDDGLPLFAENLFYVEDMEWVIRMLQRAKRIRVIEPVFYNYHLRETSASRSEASLEKRLIGYHETMAQIVDDLAGYPDIQAWFEGVRYTELINSILDAKLKKQKRVCRALYSQLRNMTGKLLRGKCISAKMKVRLLAVQLMHGLRMI